MLEGLGLGNVPIVVESEEVLLNGHSNRSDDLGDLLGLGINRRYEDPKMHFNFEKRARELSRV